jgi:hypothetical protein
VAEPSESDHVTPLKGKTHVQFASMENTHASFKTEKTTQEGVHANILSFTKEPIPESPIN